MATATDMVSRLPSNLLIQLLLFKGKLIANLIYQISKYLGLWARSRIGRNWEENHKHWHFVDYHENTKTNRFMPLKPEKL